MCMCVYTVTWWLCGTQQRDSSVVKVTIKLVRGNGEMAELKGTCCSSENPALIPSTHTAA